MSATIKQKKAMSFIAKGDSTSKAMRKAGYSKASSKNPSLLTERKGFKALLEVIGVTDEKLAKRLNEGLDATRAVVMGTKSEESFVDIQPDYAVRHKYLETGLKLRGHAKDDTNINLNFNKFINERSKRYIIEDNET